jgi:hypothetical protein
VDAPEHGFKEGDPVWVEDGDGRHHRGVFVGDNEAAGWFGGGPSAYVVHPEAHQAEVVAVYRITPRTSSVTRRFRRPRPEDER